MRLISRPYSLNVNLILQFKTSDRNWLTFLSYLDAVFVLASTSSPNNTSGLKDAHVQLSELAKLDGRKERGSHLAALEFEKRLRGQPESLAGLDLIESRRPLPDLISSYFNVFGDKDCCYEDLAPYVSEPWLKAGERIAVMDLLKTDYTNVWFLSLVIHIMVYMFLISPPTLPTFNADFQSWCPCSITISA